MKLWDKKKYFLQVALNFIKVRQKFPYFSNKKFRLGQVWFSYFIQNSPTEFPYFDFRRFEIMRNEIMRNEIMRNDIMRNEIMRIEIMRNEKILFVSCHKFH